MWKFKESGQWPPEDDVYQSLEDVLVKLDSYHGANIFWLVCFSVFAAVARPLKHLSRFNPAAGGAMHDFGKGVGRSSYSILFLFL